MLADVTIAFVDGLVVRAPLVDEARVAFDIFVLAILSLAE